MYKQCRPTQSKLSQNLSRNMSVDYGRFVLSVAYQSSIWGPLYTVERFGWMKLPDKSESKCFWRGDRSKGSMRRYSDLATSGAHHAIFWSGQGSPSISTYHGGHQPCKGSQSHPTSIPDRKEGENHGRNPKKPCSNLNLFTFGLRQFELLVSARILITCLCACWWLEAGSAIL